MNKAVQLVRMPNVAPDMVVHMSVQLVCMTMNMLVQLVHMAVQVAVQVMAQMVSKVVVMTCARERQHSQEEKQNLHPY